MSNLTPKESFIVSEAIKMMPENWASFANDSQVLAFVNLVLADINLWPPATGYTLEGIISLDSNNNVKYLDPSVWNILKFGVSFYSLLFHQMRASLQDFNFSDSGLTVSVDQTTKVNSAITTMATVYVRLLTNLKKTEVLRVGAKSINTPRYQSQLGQFLKIALGSAFNWNST